MSVAYPDIPLAQFGPKPVRIIPGTKQIIFFNIYEPLRLEYYNTSYNIGSRIVYEASYNYGSDILLKGISKLCLCSTAWQINIGTRALHVNTSYNYNTWEYQLKEIPCETADSVLYICVLKRGEEWNANYEALINSPQISHVMKTFFYNEEDEYFSCKELTNY